MYECVVVDVAAVAAIVTVAVGRPRAKKPSPGLRVGNRARIGGAKRPPCRWTLCGMCTLYGKAYDAATAAAATDDDGGGATKHLRGGGGGGGGGGGERVRGLVLLRDGVLGIEPRNPDTLCAMRVGGLGCWPPLATSLPHCASCPPPADVFLTSPHGLGAPVYVLWVCMKAAPLSPRNGTVNLHCGCCLMWLVE
ncbi:hypothetical protein Vretimale_8693 [Volvox reticuliferus]|uniref:Uncharacterized protein n=1 Tax=Volvox reticuliferus TaxID=1737510 RepID=A0A8J4LNY9_9CHLO|nr:hypothetical protein Vretimale_8693 [Volvox reticuliferus]